MEPSWVRCVSVDREILRLVWPVASAQRTVIVGSSEKYKGHFRRGSFDANRPVSSHASNFALVQKNNNRSPCRFGLNQKPYTSTNSCSAALLQYHHHDADRHLPLRGRDWPCCLCPRQPGPCCSKCVAFPVRCHDQVSDLLSVPGAVSNYDNC